MSLDLTRLDLDLDLELEPPESQNLRTSEPQNLRISETQENHHNHNNKSAAGRTIWVKNEAFAVIVGVMGTRARAGAPLKITDALGEICEFYRRHHECA